MKKEIRIWCPICGNSSRIIGVVPTIDPKASEIVDLRRCSTCGHWWHSPVPNQEVLSKLYGQASPFVVSSGAKQKYLTKITVDAFSGYVLGRVNNLTGNYLEIGPGGGALLRQFRVMGYNCYGVDPGQWVVDSTIVSNLENLPNNLRFNVLVLQDVLEHVYDPVELLSKLRCMLAKHAVVFCSFPCKDSRPARIRKTAWNMVRPYGHLHYFSFDSAKKMFSSANLTIEDMHLAEATTITSMLRARQFRSSILGLLRGTRDQIFAQLSCP